VLRDGRDAAGTAGVPRMKSARSSGRAQSRASAAPRAWQRMLSGRRLDLLDPSPLDIEIEDIAHGLARVARWNGQTEVDHRLALALMLHDAPEYVIGDMISPFKAIIGGSYKAVENRLLAAIHLRFGLPPALPAEVGAIIKTADYGAAFLEATVLAGFGVTEARRFFGPRPALPATVEKDYLTPWPAETAKHRFLEHFATLVED
jgi:5'-deoxynucleotidase YfbR-like HD superfamily hydrolase